jgi:hypothetical protein
MASLKVGASLNHSSAPHTDNSDMERKNEPWDNHEFLESETAASMGATVEHVHEWHWQDVWLLGASKVTDVGVEWDALLSSGCFGHRHGDTQDRIGTELGLVLCTIEGVEELVDS